jgi:hypothetical protein
MNGMPTGHGTVGDAGMLGGTPRTLDLTQLGSGTDPTDLTFSRTLEPLPHSPLLGITSSRPAPLTVVVSIREVWRGLYLDLVADTDRSLRM